MEPSRESVIAASEAISTVEWQPLTVENLRELMASQGIVRGENDDKDEENDTECGGSDGKYPDEWISREKFGSGKYYGCGFMAFSLLPFPFSFFSYFELG